jgi:hypothetical protein
MNTSQLLFKSGVALAALLSLATFSTPAVAAPVNVQTLATASNAAAGESGANIGSSALIDVLVTDANGNPVTNLGTNVGNGNSAITLPTGWILNIPTVPPGGCLVTPTQFSNQRDGVYSIRVVPFVNNASCRWLSGDYIYRVQVDTSSYDGSGLGILSIR